MNYSITPHTVAEFLAGAGLDGPFCATLGNFDGVHRGHQALIQATVTEARRSGVRSVGITLYPHPGEVFGQGRFNGLLAPLRKVELMLEYGLDAVLVLPFTEAFARGSAQWFCQEVLARRLKVRKFIVGHDCHLGCDGAGRERLAEYGQSLEFTIHETAAVTYEGQPISSSRIRESLEHGRLEAANAMLGRSHEVSGKVIHGQGRGGALLGFPTANMAVAGLVMPEPAIYATRSRLVPCRSLPSQAGSQVLVALGNETRSALSSEESSYLSMTSFGKNPTFADTGLTLETYILDFSQDIYGKCLEIGFEKMMRREKKFSGPEALAAQLTADRDQRRQLN